MAVTRFFENPRMERLAKKGIKWLQRFLADPKSWWENHKYTLTLVVIVLVCLGAFCG